ncbi:MAG: BamA/TamA family outer membrane protein [Planctomycetota bacterium]
MRSPHERSSTRPSPLLAWRPALLILLAACSTTATDDQPLTSIDVAFEGQSSAFEFRLRRVIEDLLIDFEKHPEDEAPLYDAAQDLRDHYQTLGFPDAKVSYRLERGRRPRVVFVVDEGPRVTIEEVTLEGNHALGDDELRALWSRTQSGLVGTGDPYFVAEELAAWRVSMRALYGLRGFLDAKVSAPEVTRPPGSSAARVRFTIDEGTRYSVADFAVAAELPLDRARLGLDQEVGADYDRDRLEMLRQRARLQLESDGYPAPHIELGIERDGAAHTVHARLSGSAGKRAKVVGVEIEGLDRTARSVIDRAIRFHAGEWYDGSKVEETTREAYLTGLFRRVDVERRPASADGSELILVVVVEELKARELDFLAGYGSYESLRGGIAFTDRNVLGRGHRATVGARASFKSLGLSASWTVPNVLGTKTSLTTAGYVREREEPTFTDRSRGVDVALARNLTRSLRGRVGYALQSRDANTSDDLVRGAAPSAFEIGSVFAELVLDRRDSPLYPAHGHREELKVESARSFLGGTVDLDRVSWSATLFHSLAEDVVVGLGLSGGITWPHDETGLPVQERFFNGGESSVRSFKEARLGPLSVTGVPEGGQFYNVFGAELRFPIVGALHGAVFGDAGNVGKDADAYGLSDLRYGIGAGLRLVLPIGPVRLDGAVNPDRRPGEETWVLHLSVGLPF